MRRDGPRSHDFSQTYKISQGICLAEPNCYIEEGGSVIKYLIFISIFLVYNLAVLPPKLQVKTLFLRELLVFLDGGDDNIIRYKEVLGSFFYFNLLKSAFSSSFQYIRSLQIEYEQLKEQHLHRGINPLASPPDSIVSPHHAEDAELIAEAKLLRQHKGRLEARMQILEDHNKQLESQLHRLRQLLEQVDEHLL